MKLFYLFAIAIISGCSNNKSAIETGLEGKPMPSFKLLLMDSTSNINTATIPNDKPVILLFISPTCPYCQAQTEDIIKSVSSLKDIRIYILSSLPFSGIKEFYTRNNLKQYSTIITGYDYESFFPGYFNVFGIPFIAIYNKEKILKEVLVGRESVDKIKKVAFEN